MGLRSCSCPVLVLLLLGLLVPAVLGACSNNAPCTNQPECTGCDPYDPVPDPTDCRRYYMCKGSGTDYYENPIECQAGQVFEVTATSRGCVDGDTCDSCTSSGGCQYKCVANGPQFVSDLLQCNIYTECNGATVVATHSCDSTAPYFDGNQCQTDPTRCCHCQPYCDAAGKFIVDPQDCRKYYICQTANSVPTASGTCDEGTFFDSGAQTCTATAPCNTPVACENVVDQDGCIEPFTCNSVGYFAKCPYAAQCSKYYYHCTENTGEYQPAETCYTGTVFHPDTHICVAPEDCP